MREMSQKRIFDCKWNQLASWKILLAWIFLASPINLQSESTLENWPHYGGSFQFWRYSGLDQIIRSNVKDLKVVWAFQTGVVDGGLQATPIVLDGVMYLSSSWNRVFAINAATG